MSPRGAWGLAAIAGLLAGCPGPATLPATWALGASPASAQAAPGEVAGRAVAWRDGAFAPLEGAAVLVDGVALGPPTGAGGAFRLAGVAPGERSIAVAAEGLAGVAVAVRPAADAGVAGVVLPAYVPVTGPAGRGERRLVGVVTTPAGAALPGATVHCVDTGGGNRRWTADAAGLFAGTLADVPAGGTASLMAYGRTADGRTAEGQAMLVVALPDPVTGVAVATHVLGPPLPSGERSGP